MHLSNVLPLPDKKIRMQQLFIEYPACSTCQKAKKWLIANQVEFSDRHIVEANPSEEELREWISASGLPMKSFFNTSGQSYRALNLTEKLPTLSEDEQIKLLASDGKLIKRPLLISGQQVLVGFKLEQWEQNVR
jgi:arsenate reductase (glutaredoxin)